MNDEIRSGEFRLNGASYPFSVGLCRKSLDSLTPSMEKWLSAAELKAAHHYQYPMRQHSFLVGRYIAKKTLACYLEAPEMDLREVEIKNGVLGQPVLSQPLWLSISHSKHYGLAVCSPLSCPITVDIEETEMSGYDHLLSVMTENEKTLSELNQSDNKGLFYVLIWTMKEALSKFLMGGLSIDYRILSVSNVVISGNSTHASFEHFPHLKAYSLCMRDAVSTFVYPSNGDLHIPQSHDFSKDNF